MRTSAVGLDTRFVYVPGQSGKFRSLSGTMRQGNTYHADIESFGEVDAFLRVIQAVCESCDNEDAEK